MKSYILDGKSVYKNTEDVYFKSNTMDEFIIFTRDSDSSEFAFRGSGPNLRLYIRDSIEKYKDRDIISHYSIVPLDNVLVDDRIYTIGGSISDILYENSTPCIVNINFRDLEFKSTFLKNKIYFIMNYKVYRIVEIQAVPFVIGGYPHFTIKLKYLEG